MMQNWLGRTWNEVEPEIENLGKPFTFQITRPHGKMESWGDCRVVRIRESGDRIDVVLANEIFSLRQTLTP